MASVKDLRSKACVSYLFSDFRNECMLGCRQRYIVEMRRRPLDFQTTANNFAMSSPDIHHGNHVVMRLEQAPPSPRNQLVFTQIIAVQSI